MLRIHLCTIRIILAFFLSATLLISACGGGGNSSNSSSSDSSSSSSTGDTAGTSGSITVPPVQLSSNQGQALLGPIVDATVDVYNAENFDGTLLCTTTTSSQDASEGPGIIDLSSCPVEENSLYLLVVKDGMDIDSDDDGILDSIPTPMEGTIRAIISSQNILNGDFRVNILTELGYQSISDLLLSDDTSSALINRLNIVAKQLLTEDLNEDGIIDYEDMLHFSPLTDSDSIPIENSGLLDDILNAILTGNRSELTSLSRQYLLSSLGEYSFIDLVDPNNTYQNLLISDFIVENDYIYAAGSDADSPGNDIKVFIFDATDISNVTLLGEYSEENLPANPQNIDMVKSGDYLYLVSKDVGLLAVNISDPSSPSGSLHFEGDGFTSITCRDSTTIYISYNYDITDSGIRIIDITNPAQPEIINSINNINIASDLHYENGYLYFSGAGIGVLDASTPGTLSVLSDVNFSNEDTRNIRVKNGFAYMPFTFVNEEGGTQGITIVDVKDPQNIHKVDSIFGMGFIHDLTINGETLYATASTGSGTSAISDMLLSFTINEDGSLDLTDSRSTPQAFQVDYENEMVFVNNSTGFAAYDANALNKKTNHLGFLATSKSANFVEVVGNIVYVADDTDLLAIDVSDPSDMSVLDSVSVIDSIEDMQIAGNYIYLANATEGIKIIDISDPSNLMITGSNDILTPLYDDSDTLIGNQVTKSIAVDGDKAYTITGTSPQTIGVFSVSDPATPSLISSIPSSLYLKDIGIKDNTLYGVNGGTFIVVDIESDTPVHLSDQDQTLYAKTLEVYGDYVYTTSGTSGLSILNVSNATNPALSGYTPSLGVGNAVSVVSNVAYVANEFGMVEVYDVTDKTDPKFIGIYPIGGVVKDVYATEDYVYAVNGIGLIIEPSVKLHSAFN